jgi:hypothetical protein
MKIMIPTKITDSMISDYTLSYTEPSAWSASTSYTAGMRASVGKDVYECITANTNAYPPNNTTNYNWIYVGVSNKNKAFDDKINTKTESTGSISFTITPNAIVNGIALFNVLCASVKIVMTDKVDGEVYNREISTVSDKNVEDMFDWLFNDFEQKSDVTIFDLPPYRTASISVTISGAEDETVSVGMVLVGQVKEVGLLNWGASVGIIDFSTKETDPFGNVTVVPRESSKRANYDIDVETRRVDFIQKELQTYKTTPIVWVGSENMESTIVYGYYRDFSQVISNLIKSKCTVEVEGLI